MSDDIFCQHNKEVHSLDVRLSNIFRIAKASETIRVILVIQLYIVPSTCVATFISSGKVSETVRSVSVVKSRIRSPSMCVTVIQMIAKILEAVSTVSATKLYVSRISSIFMIFFLMGNVAESVKTDSIVTLYVRCLIQPDIVLEAVKFDIIIGSYIRSTFIETIVMLSRSVYSHLCIVDL